MPTNKERIEEIALAIYKIAKLKSLKYTHVQTLKNFNYELSLLCENLLEELSKDEN